MPTQIQLPNSRQTIEKIHGQAVVKAQANKLEDALNLYLQSIEIDENQPEWIYANAIILATQIERCDTGFKLKRKAENLHPKSDEISRAVALLFYKQNNRQDAIKYFQKTIAFNPEQPEWLYAKLFALLNKSKLTTEAFKIQQQGLKRFPKSTVFTQEIRRDLTLDSQQTASAPQTLESTRITPQSIEHIVDLDVSERRRKLMDSAIVERYQILLEQMLLHVKEGVKEMDSEALIHCLAEIKTDIHYLRTKLLSPPASAVDPQAKSTVDIQKIISPASAVPIKCELKERIVGSGWHAQEKHGRWTGPGTLSSVVLPYPTAGKYKLEIIVRAEARSGLLQTLKISAGDRTIDFDLTKTGNTSFPAVVTGEIAIAPQQNQPFLAIDLAIAETVNPPASDARLLGLLVEKITLIPLIP